MTLKQMKVGRDDLKIFFEVVATQTLVQHEEVEGLKKSLEEGQSALKSTKDWVSQLMDNIVVASV